MSNNERTNMITEYDDPNEREYNNNVNHYDSDCDSGSYGGSGIDSKDVIFMNSLSSANNSAGLIDKSNFVDVFTNETGNDTTVTSVEGFSDESVSDSDEYSSFVYELKGIRSKKANLESFLNGCLVFASSGVAGHPEAKSNDTNDVVFQGATLGIAENDLENIPGESKMHTNRRPSYFLRRRKHVVWRLLLLFVAAVTISIVIVWTAIQPQQLEDNNDKNSAALLLTNDTAGRPPLQEDYIAFADAPLIDLVDVPLTNKAKASSTSGPSNNSGAVNHINNSHKTGDSTPYSDADDMSDQLGAEARTTHTGRHQNYYIQITTGTDSKSSDQLGAEARTAHTGRHKNHYGN